MSFAADSPLVAQLRASPNFEPRRGGPADMLILHYTGMASAQEALERLCDAASKVSSHYFVFEDGRCLQLVAETARAWHAGASSWKGETDINSCSIGIEIANPGHDGGYPDFPETQMAAVTALCADIVARNAIPAARVLGHSDVAPGRKSDPGEKFDWARLARAGAGVYRQAEPLAAGPVLATGSSGGDVEDLQRNLARIGYGIEASGHFDAATLSVVAAFQRHFRPELVDGRADISTIMTLKKLLPAFSK